jgi:hypothetical protein
MGSGEFQRMRHPAMWAKGNHGVLLARDVVATSANRLVHSLSQYTVCPNMTQQLRDGAFLHPFYVAQICVATSAWPYRELYLCFTPDPALNLSPGFRYTQI